MKVKDWLVLAGFVALSEAAGFIGSFFTIPSIGSWYATLVRPEFSPPNWVFGPVWTMLYLLMGTSAFLVWKHHSHILENVRMMWVWKIGIALFLLQLMLNALWSALFFGLHSPILGLLDIAALWIAILATVIAFSRISRAAAWLMVPYLVWVSFAVYLNYAIWTLN